MKNGGWVVVGRAARRVPTKPIWHEGNSLDSVTQIALGAAVCEAVIGRQVGHKALLWGAIAGTIPDLDVLVPFDDPIKDFTYHRSLSHSFLFLTVLTPILTWLIVRIHPSTHIYRSRWLKAVFLALITHPILDCFTVYGTQIFWPFSEYPVTWSTVFIIDPAYTLPLLIGSICALVMSRHSLRGCYLNRAGLIVSSAYLVFSLVGKWQVERAALSTAARYNLSNASYVTTAAPFTTLLWRVVFVDGNRYGEGFYSLFDEADSIRLTWYDSEPPLLHSIADTWPVQRLKWFTKGFYRVRAQNDHVSITDLRMGQEPFYVFSFIVGEIKNGLVMQKPTTRNPSERADPDQVLWIWDRIWDETK